MVDMHADVCLRGFPLPSLVTRDIGAASRPFESLTFTEGRGNAGRPSDSPERSHLDRGSHTRDVRSETCVLPGALSLLRQSCSFKGR